MDTQDTLNTKRHEIMSAALKELRNSSYKDLTVRNICKAAQISIGTFYYYFQNKDVLLTFCFNEIYLKYIREQDTEQLSPCQCIVEIFSYLVKEFLQYGIGFIYNLMDIHNHSLCMDQMSEEPYNNQLAAYLFDKLNKAQEMHMLSTEKHPHELLDEINILFFGSIFYWGINDGSFDLQKVFRDQLCSLLNKYIPEGNKVI